MRFARIVFVWLLFCSAAVAQVGQIPGWPPLQPAPVVGGYSGPADVATGLIKFGSCARAVSAAYANGTNPLCDLVDSAAPTTVICTLRVRTNGFVDLTGTYCTGSVTPATKCAAATGGVCNISQVYDQLAGSGSHWTQATAANQFKLAFSALNSLPGMQGTNASSSRATTGTVTQTAPFSTFAVFERTANFTNTTMAMQAGGNQGLGPWSAANSIACRNAAGATLTDSTHSTDSVFHAAQCVNNAGSSSINVDGFTTSGTLSNNSISGTSDIGRFSGAGLSLDGITMEVGLVNGASSGADVTAINSNAHSSTNGYNF